MPRQPNRPTDDVWSAPESGTVLEPTPAKGGGPPTGPTTRDGGVSIRVPPSPGEGVTEEEVRRSEAETR